MAVLTWLSGEAKNQQVPVDGEVILGRGKHVQVVLDDQRSSREHARVFCKEDRYFIEDLGSRNGTFLNETQVGREPVPLSIGDNIRIGLSWFCFGEPKIGEDNLESFVGYQVTQQLLHQQGGMLLEAEQEGLDRKVHLRVLSVQIAKNQQYIHHQFMLEVKVLAKLVHRNIALMLDFGSRNMFLYAAFEALEGEELTGYVETHQPLPLPRVLEIARGVARGMEYAERQDVHHLRLAPQVILLSRGRPIINDFGMSRLAGEMAKDEETGVGGDVSPYMAPEQASGKEGDVRSDVYAFGMLLYFLLTGKPPFAQTSPYELLDAIKAGQFEPVATHRPDVPAPLADAIGRMTAQAPAERLGSFRDVLDLLDACEREADLVDIRAEDAKARENEHPLVAAALTWLAQPTNCWIAFPGAAVVLVVLIHLIF